MLSIMISSTFNDMQAERDIIHQKVVPRLRRAAAGFGESVRLLDLRWGVNTESMSEEMAAQKVLDVCLDEIDRCDGYMVCLLGQRYGWIPDYSKITSVENHHIRMETPISVTELEIEYGILQRNQGEKAIIFFRDEIENLPDSLKPLYCDSVSDQRLPRLKARLEALPRCTCRHYSLSWRTDGEFDGLDEFAERLLASLTALLQNIYGQAKPLSAFERKEQLFQSYIKEQADTYFPVPVLERALKEFIAGKKQFLVIQGAGGMGKSAFSAHICAEPPENISVIPYFCRIGSSHSRPEDLLIYYINQICRLTGNEPAPPSAPLHELVLYFTELLYSTSLPVWFVADGTDQLSCSPEEIISWIPNRLPEHVRIILTTSPGNNACRQLGEFWPVQYETIPELERPEDFIARLLSAGGQQIPDELVRQAVNTGMSGNYLYNTMVVRMLMLIDRHDFAAINEKGGGINVINNYIREKLIHLPNSLESMGFLLMYDCGEQIAPGMAEKFLTAVSAVPAGLRSQDLEALFPELWDEIRFEQFTAFLDEFLAVDENGCYQFTRPFLKYASQQILDYRFIPRLSDYLESLPDNDPVKVNSGLRIFLAVKRYEAVISLIKNHLDSETLQEQFLEIIPDSSSSISVILAENEILEWFLETIVPRMNSTPLMEAGIRILKSLPGQKERSLQEKLLYSLGDLYEKNHEERKAWETYLKLLPLIEEDGSSEELASLEIKIVANAFVDDKSGHNHVLTLLGHALKLFESCAALSPDALTASLRGRFYQQLITLQECYFIINGPSYTLHDYMYHKDTSGSRMPLISSILFIGLHSIDGHKTPPEITVSLLNLCRLGTEAVNALLDGSWEGNKEECRQILLDCFSALLRADPPDSPPDTEHFPDEYQKRLKKFREERLLLFRQARLEIVLNLRSGYHINTMKQFARLNFLLARTEPENAKKTELLERSCQIWERYFNVRSLPDFADDLQKALLNLAELYLKDKRYDEYKDTLDKWAGISISILKSKIDIYFPECQRYPDEIHCEELEHLRRQYAQIYEDFVERLWLREYYETKNNIENILACIQFYWHQHGTHPTEGMYLPQLFRNAAVLVSHLKTEVSKPHSEEEMKGLKHTYNETLFCSCKILIVMENMLDENSDNSLLMPDNYYKSRAQLLRKYLQAISEENDRIRQLRIAFLLAQSLLSHARYCPDEAEESVREALELLAVLEKRISKQEILPANWLFPAVSRETILNLTAQADMTLADIEYKNEHFSNALELYRDAMDISMLLYGRKENSPSGNAFHRQSALQSGMSALRCLEQLGYWEQMEKIIKKIDIIRNFK